MSCLKLQGTKLKCWRFPLWRGKSKWCEWFAGRDVHGTFFPTPTPFSPSPGKQGVIAIGSDWQAKHVMGLGSVRKDTVAV